MAVDARHADAPERHGRDAAAEDEADDPPGRGREIGGLPRAGGRHAQDHAHVALDERRVEHVERAAGRVAHVGAQVGRDRDADGAGLAAALRRRAISAIAVPRATANRRAAHRAGRQRIADDIAGGFIVAPADGSGAGAAVGSPDSIAGRVAEMQGRELRKRPLAIRDPGAAAGAGRADRDVARIAAEPAAQLREAHAHEAARWPARAPRFATPSACA